MSLFVKIVIFFCSLSLSLYANYAQTYNYEDVAKDFKAQNSAKYQVDTLDYLDSAVLIRKGIITDASQLTKKHNAGTSYNSFVSSISCGFVTSEFTATIYSIIPEEGVVTCMVAKKGDVYNPLGLFETKYPEMINYFKIDKDSARAINANKIKTADGQFADVYTLKNNISNSINPNSTSSNYLAIPQLLTSAILTDTDIIDLEDTINTGKLQLKSNFTSKYTDERDGGEPTDNAQYILFDAENIFANYKDLASLSMTYLVLLVVFFGIYGIGKIIASSVADKIEEGRFGNKKLPFGAGIVAGIILFFPVNDGENIVGSNGTVEQYETMKTRYQDYEKEGYYLFTQWATEAAKVIIDNQIDAIIDKSGVGTGEQIVNSYAGLKRYEKLNSFAESLNTMCTNSFYDVSKMADDDKKFIYSENQNIIFPSTENYAYAASLNASGTTTVYYSPVGSGGLALGGSGATADTYPKVSLSACGKMFAAQKQYYNKKQDFNNTYVSVAAVDPSTDAKKVTIIKGLVEFQYELYRDWSYLAVLGLPVVKMQTEFIGGLYDSASNDVLDKLEDEVSKDSWGGASHTIMSTLPYLFIPGAGTVYNVMSDNAGKLGAAAGGAVAGGATAGMGAIIGALIGGVVGTVGGGVVGMWGAYHTAKTILGLAPILGLVIVGLLRFLIIIVKIFVFHFASLFLMPIMFAKENVQAISKFTMKVFATMIEIPLFVLSVWLAMMASSILQTIGDIFSKRIIIGMLENTANSYQNVETTGGASGEFLAKLKIYVFDGLMEVLVAVFCIVVIYKLVVTLHSMVLDSFEINGSTAIDNTIDSMKSESQGYGAKI